jgi:hypothetical protein
MIQIYNGPVHFHHGDVNTASSTHHGDVNTTTSTHHGEVNTSSSTITSNVPVPPQPYKTPEDERDNNNGPVSPRPNSVPILQGKTPEQEKDNVPTPDETSPEDGNAENEVTNSDPASSHPKPEDEDPVENETIIDLTQDNNGAIGVQGGWNCGVYTFDTNDRHLSCSICKTVRGTTVEYLAQVQADIQSFQQQDNSISSRQPSAIEEEEEQEQSEEEEEQEQSEEEEEQECILCGQPIAEIDSIDEQMPCHHQDKFHISCLIRWFWRGPTTCPICRTNCPDMIL